MRSRAESMNQFAYPAYQALSDLMLPLRHGAALVSRSLDAWPAIAQTPQARALRANCDMLALAGLTHARPPFAIDSIEVDGRTVGVTEDIADSTPFCSLVHFVKDDASLSGQPRVLVIAPMSGHFATLLRGTVRTMLADHDVYITDWHNPRDVALIHGRFGFDEYVHHIIDFIETIGPGSHLLAVCQPTVAASAATHGWQTATTWPPGPTAARKSIRWATYSSRPKRPSPSGTSRTLCQSVT